MSITLKHTHTYTHTHTHTHTQTHTLTHRNTHTHTLTHTLYKRKDIPEEPKRRDGVWLKSKAGLLRTRKIFSLWHAYLLIITRTNTC